MKQIKFVNVTLPDGMVGALDDGKGVDVDSIAEWINSMALLGYKVGVSYSADKNSFIVAVTGNGTPENDATCFTQFGGTLATACNKARFFHDVVCNGGSWLDGKQQLDAFAQEAMRAYSERFHAERSAANQKRPKKG